MQPIRFLYIYIYICRFFWHYVQYFLYNLLLCFAFTLGAGSAYEGVKCLSLEMVEGGRDRGRERRAAELIAPRHLFQPMLKNYSTVPPDTAFYPQKDHC